MTNSSPDENDIENPAGEYDAVAALTIKVFVSMIFTVSAVVVVLAAVGFVFGVWSTVDHDLATTADKVN